MEHQTAEHVAEVLKAVAHPVRLQIIEALEYEEKCVGDLVQALEIPQAAVSQQLGLMKDKDVLQCRREGTKAFYSIKNANVINLLHCVYHHCDRNGNTEEVMLERNER